MYQGKRQQARRRSKAISCELCRARKLRCNRQFPCSNCTARGVKCLAPAVQKRNGQRGSVDQTQPSVPPDTSANLIRRLESLEALLAAKISNSGASQLRCLVNDAHAGRASSPDILYMLSDALILERQSMGSKAKETQIRLITKPSSLMLQNDSFNPHEPVKCVLLPLREEARQLIDKYLNDISFIHQVTHARSVKHRADEVYSAIDSGRCPSLETIALLLAIFANSTSQWATRDMSRCLFCSVSDAHSQALLWQIAGLDVLDHLQRDSHVSLEATQAMVLLCYSIVNLEGVTIKFRNIFSRAVAMARELGLHCIDLPRQLLSLVTPKHSLLEAEIGRRVWWYLCSTDWIVAGLSGTLGNVCLISPSQMAVNKPKNVNDDDIIEGKEIIARPMDQPTCMSFALQRIRLAEVFRASLEQTQFAGLSPEAIGLQQVQELDAQLVRFWDSTPAFLRLNQDSGGMKDDQARMRIQQYVLQLFVHGQRCRIHLPFLARGASYATSRIACVESARVIIRLEEQLQQRESEFASSRLRLSIVLHHIYLAFVVLLFDLCLDASGSVNMHNCPEMTAGWKILAEAKTQLQQAEVLIEPLRKVMRRYRVLPFDDGVSCPQSTGGILHGTAVNSTSSAELDGMVTNGDTEHMKFVPDWNNLRTSLALSRDEWSNLLEGLSDPGLEISN
ncbi:hypothetical protein Landi51_11271 [Colletotrichum acutatum]